MMTPSYRIVQFVPDPFSGARVPVAALVSDGDHVRVVSAPHIPGADCLGGPRRAALVRMILDALRDVTGFEVLPHAVGPQAVLDEARQAPARDLDAAERWVRDYVLPQGDKTVKGEPVGSRSPNRSTFGKRFFETWRVAEYVHPTFNPSSDFGGRLASLAAYGEASQWVEGPDSVLLLEPIVPRRNQFRDDVRDVAKLFGACRNALNKNPLAIDAASLVAYVLAGASDVQKADIAAGLPDANRVVDTEDDVDRRRFIEQIQDLGRRGDRQQHAPAEG